MHNFLACACKFLDFAQSHKKFARSHDRTTVTFRNSDTALTNAIVPVDDSLLMHSLLAGKTGEAGN